MNNDINPYLEKATESLAGAESEYVNGRYNNCANRCYYACLQAAVSALVAAGIDQPRSGKWRHEFVKGQFGEQLIKRQKRYPAELAVILERGYQLRQDADYEDYAVSKPQGERQLRRARVFVTAIKGGEKR